MWLLKSKKGAMPPYFLGRVMDFRTFNENADAAAERRAAMDQQRQEVKDKMKAKTELYQKRKGFAAKGITKPNAPTSSATDSTGKTVYSRDAED